MHHPGGNQKHPDNPDRLLRIIAAMAKRRPTLKSLPIFATSTASLRRGVDRRKSTKRIIISEPSTIPSNGEIRMNETTVLDRHQSNQRGPAFAIAAPIKPPIKACDDDEGMP